MWICIWVQVEARIIPKKKTVTKTTVTIFFSTMTKTLKNGPKHKTRKYKCPPFQGICMLTYYNYLIAVVK